MRCRQVEGHSEVKTIAISFILHELVSHIDLEYNLDCSKLILEIVDKVVGAYSDTLNPSCLLLSADLIKDIYLRLI